MTFSATCSRLYLQIADCSYCGRLNHNEVTEEGKQISFHYSLYSVVCVYVHVLMCVCELVIVSGQNSP